MAEGDGQEVAWLDELVEQIRRLHDLVLERSGGVAGEHTARLHASCARPFQTAFGELIFALDIEQGAVLFHGLICNHVFVDGNKRTGTLALILFLTARGYIRDAPSQLQIRLIGEVAVATASGALDVNDVAKWLRRILEP